MKPLILVVLLLICTTTYSFEKTLIPNFEFSQTKPLKKFNLQGSVTLSGGCTVSYDLVLDISIIPLGFNSLSGTLSMSGNCTGVQTLNITTLRGRVNQETKMTSFFIIEEDLFNDKGLQLDFEKYLIVQINENREEIFSE